MESTTIQKVARVLNALVLITLICNLIILYLVPAAVLTDSPHLLGGIREYLAGIFFPAEDDIVLAGVAASFISWFWCWQDPHDLVLILFLVVSGICTARILLQARRVLRSVLDGQPFTLENADALSRAARCAFLVAAAAMARLLFSMGYYRSIRPLTTYNALFVPLFAVFGLLCLVMAALFRQAAELREETDLTI